MKRLTLLFTVLCAALALGVGPVGAGQAAPESPSKAATTPSMLPTKVEPLDLNAASVDELKALPGIGDACSRKIVENRP